jgi:anti-sigma factor ChrR (cupin superfamily)
MIRFDLNPCEQSEVTCTYALQGLPASELPAIEAHIASCPDCQRELESLRSVVNRFVSWPTDVLCPTTALHERLARRISEETGKQPVLPPVRRRSEPEWEQVAPGIECKLLAIDTERHRVSMLVRLAPGASYPAHIHAGVEELHLLDGELWIDGHKLVPGDYNYGAPGAGDERVWSDSHHQHERYSSLKRLGQPHPVITVCAASACTATQKRCWVTSRSTAPSAPENVLFARY